MGTRSMTKRHEPSAISQWIAENRKASVEKERIRAANRERVAQIHAVRDMYCAQVDERIARDTNLTAFRIAGANAAVASAHMVAHVVRARCDESIARIGERTEQFQALSRQQVELQKALTFPGLGEADRQWVIGELKKLRQDQDDLRTIAEHEARRLPPLVLPVGYLSGSGRDNLVQEGCA